MVQDFKVDGFFIPISFDSNKDSKLQVSELNIWCVANDMKYQDGKIKTCIPFDVENVPEKFDEKKYSIENIKKRYPDNKFNVFGNENIVVVCNRDTGERVFYLNKSSDGKIEICFYDDLDTLCCSYDSSGKLIGAKSDINGEKKVYSPLVDKLHKDVSAKNTWGMPTTGKNIEAHINSLNVDNIKIVLKEYQNRYETSLIADIFAERGLDAQVRANYAKQIVDVLCERAGDSDDIKKIKEELYKIIQHEADKTGMMDSTEIDKLINILSDEFDYAGNALIAHNLRKDVCAKNAIGLPTTANTIGENVRSINAENVAYIMGQYEKQTGGKSLFSDIIEERGLSTNARTTYIKHIVNAYFTYAKNQGINVNDLEQKFNKEITYQMEKFGFANADYLDVFLRQLKNRRLSVYSNTEISNPNGKIDEKFAQRSTGDCWLLASIKAISNSPKGLQILNDSIEVNSDGSVTVTLKGVNKTYTISKEELESNIQLAIGDGDVRALEIAVNKYFEEERGVNGKLDIEGNWMYIAYGILVGDKNIDDGRNNIFQFFANGLENYKDIDDELIDSFNDPNKITTVAADGDKRDVQVMAGKIEQVLTTGHAYAVLRADSKYVYLVNPWKSDSEIKITREQFKEFFNEYNQMEL